MFHVEQPARCVRLWIRGPLERRALEGGSVAFIYQACAIGFVCLESRPSHQDVMGPERLEVRPCRTRPPPLDVGAIHACSHA